MNYKKRCRVIAMGVLLEAGEGGGGPYDVVYHVPIVEVLCSGDRFHASPADDRTHAVGTVGWLTPDLIFSVS